MTVFQLYGKRGCIKEIQKPADPAVPQKLDNVAENQIYGFSSSLTNPKKQIAPF